METSDDGQANRRRARQVAQHSLHVAIQKSYDQTLSEGDYAHVHEVCKVMLIVCFGNKLRSECVVEIVQMCLSEMLTPLFGAPVTVGQLLSAHDVLHRMFDHALDLVGRSGTCETLSTSHASRKMALSDDEALERAFIDGVTRHQYDVALEQARAFDQADEFRVVTQYMSHLQQTGESDFSEVAKVLHMSTRQVKEALDRFLKRIPRGASKR